jgi:hypothetical protein
MIGHQRTTWTHENGVRAGCVKNREETPPSLGRPRDGEGGESGDGDGDGGYGIGRKAATETDGFIHHA